MSNIKLNIRPAKRTDCPALIGLKKELALHQSMDKPMLSSIDIERDGFNNSPPAFHCIVAESDASQEVIGFALYFFGYCVKSGKMVHLEDFCVTKNLRNSGAGTALFQELARIAVKEKCSRIQLEVLAWNMVGLKFYDKNLGINMSLGEQALHTFRLDQDAIQKLANSLP